MQNKRVMLLQKNQKHRGYSLVELAIVLSILGLIMGSIWSLSGSGGSKAKQEALTEQAMLIVNNTRAFYQASSGVSTTITDACLTSCLVAEKLVPPEMVRTFSTDATACKGTGSCTAIVDHPWGVNATTTGAGGVLVGHGPTKQHFILKMRGLTQENCANVALRLVAPGAPPGMESLLINSATITTMPLTAQRAISSCAGAASGSTTSSLDFVYRLRAPQDH